VLAAAVQSTRTRRYESAMLALGASRGTVLRRRANFPLGCLSGTWRLRATGIAVLARRLFSLQ